MTTEQILADRRKDKLTLDEVTTILWTREMGRRMALVRMKLLKDQREVGIQLGIDQRTMSRLETVPAEEIRVCEKITVATLKKVFDKHFLFIALGNNPERYNAGVITKVYWDTRLRVRRKNKSPHSVSRLLGKKN